MPALTYSPVRPEPPGRAWGEYAVPLEQLPAARVGSARLVCRDYQPREYGVTEGTRARGVYVSTHPDARKFTWEKPRVRRGLVEVLAVIARRAELQTQARVLEVRNRQSTNPESYLRTVEVVVDDPGRVPTEYSPIAGTVFESVSVVTPAPWIDQYVPVIATDRNPARAVAPGWRAFTPGDNPASTNPQAGHGIA